MVEDLLQAFLAQRDTGPFAYAYCHHHQGRGAHDFHTVIGCITHGNEHGTLPAALRLLSELASGEVAPLGPVTLLLGNPEAARADQRFLEEDFNRVFTFDRPAQSHERRRAEAVRPILDAADLFLDLHQTQTPTAKPFWTFPWDPEFGLWARAIGAAPVGLTRRAGQVFSAGTCCLDEYVRGRGKTGLTAEIGMRGQDTAQAERAYDAMRNLLATVDALRAEGASLESRASAMPPIEWYRTTHVVPAQTREHRLRPGLGNWTRVHAGETLSAPEAPMLTAPADGYVLFPKYPRPSDPPPPELYRLAERVEDPTTL